MEVHQCRQRSLISINFSSTEANSSRTTSAEIKRPGCGYQIQTQNFLALSLDCSRSSMRSKSSFKKSLLLSRERFHFPNRFLESSCRECSSNRYNRDWNLYLRRPLQNLPWPICGRCKLQEAILTHWLKT